MTPVPYERATSGDKALAELQRTLAKFGCQSFGTMTDQEEGCTIVQFKWRNRTVSLKASWRGYAAVLKKRKAISDAKAIEQAKISVCSVLRDWIKGQITAVECGVLSFDSVFMPHILLPNGERVIDHVKKAIPFEDEAPKVVELKR